MKLVSGWSNRGAFLIALVLASLGLTGSANAAGWAPAFRLTEGLSTNLTSHMNPAGDAIFTGAKLNSLGDTEIFSRVHLANGDVLPQQEIFNSSDSVLPFIFSESDQAGNVFTLWGSAEEGGCGCESVALKLTRLDAQGAPLPQPFTVLDLDGESIYLISAALSVSSDGRVTVGVSLVDDDSGESWVEIYKIDADLNSKTKLTPNGFGEDARDLDISTNSQGRTLVAWESIDRDDDMVSVWGQLVDEGGPIGTAEELSAEPVENEWRLGATLLDDSGYGTVALAEESLGEPGTAVARVAPNGTFTSTLISEAFIDAFSSLYGLNRKGFMAPLADGDVLLALVTPGDDDRVETRVYLMDSLGQIEQNHLISSSISAVGIVPSSLPSLVTRPDQSAAIAYSRIDDENDLFHSAVIYQALGSDGSPTGPEQVMAESANAFAPSIYVNPKIATVSTEKVAVTWTDIGFAASFFSASGYGRIYDAAGPLVSIKAPSKALAGSEVVLVAQVKDHSQTTTRWQFGDGGMAEGPVQTHTFAKPGSYEVKVVAEDGVGNVSEASTEIKVVSQGQDPVVISRPQTRITRPPRLRIKRPQAVIRFDSPQKNVSFECRVGRGPIAGSRQARLRAEGKGTKGLAVQGKWRKCSSPLRLRGLKPARYVVRVRAVGETGLRDLTPAVARFRVVPAKKRAITPRPAA